jgi:hypothetical protein
MEPIDIISGSGQGVLATVKSDGYPQLCISGWSRRSAS